MAVYGERRQLYIVGGRYHDGVDVVSTHYFNDLAVFSIDRRQWLSVDLRGTPPPAVRSATAHFIGSVLYVFYGCQGDGYSSQVTAFHIDRTLTARNFTVEGVGSGIRYDHA